MQVSGQGFSWETFNNYTVNRTAFLNYNSYVNDAEEGWYVPPPPKEAFTFLLIQVAMYSFLAWYFSQLCTAGDARAQPFWFIFLPDYWMGGSSSATGQASLRADLKTSDLTMPTDLDSDVAEEMKAVCSGAAPKDTTCKILEFRRVFSQLTPYDGVCKGGSYLSKFEAVKGVCLHIQHGKLFALLGHNGAGKTTLIKLITAQLAPTSGDALIHGLSVTHQASAVRRLFGICPQHDILYDELTSREHLQLYGALKGVASAELRVAIPQLLEGVTLVHVADKMAGSYSGGMKRRLSVAVSLTGEPKVVVLDEPTTGMDPMNRRFVWERIRQVKKDRSVLLTTHSMEEADALGDRIGIMSSGQLVALGSSIHLKNKFGEGYRIKVVVPRESRNMIATHVAENCPQATLVDENVGDMTYALTDASSMKEAPKFFAFIEAAQEGKHAPLAITDWGVSHTSLEDVFLRLAKDRAAKGETFKERIRLPANWTPGTPGIHISKDGFEHEVPADHLPSQEKWEKLVSCFVHYWRRPPPVPQPCGRVWPPAVLTTCCARCRAPHLGCLSGWP